MTKTEFINDDRFAVLTDTEINCAGGRKELAIQRLLDSDSDTAFEAVLDGDTVWTAKLDDDEEQIKDENGMPEIEWEELAEFVG